MKKIILLAACMIAAGSILHAQNTGTRNGNAGKNRNNSSFVDANNNTLCDNYENNTRKTVRKGTGRFAGAAGNSRQCSQPGCGRRTGGPGNKG